MNGPNPLTETAIVALAIVAAAVIAAVGIPALIWEMTR